MDRVNEGDRMIMNNKWRRAGRGSGIPLVIIRNNGLRTLRR